MSQNLTSSGCAFGGTSPAAASTVVLSTSGDLSIYDRAVVLARLVGATGGTLDVYIQSSTDNGASWYDIGHFTQLASGGAAVAWVATFTRGNGTATTARATNTADATPSIAANTFIPDGLGNRIRTVCVAGASTSAGAALTITVLFSGP